MATVHTNRTAFLRQSRVPKALNRGGVDPGLFADVLAQIRRILLDEELAQGPRAGR